MVLIRPSRRGHVYRNGRYRRRILRRRQGRGARGFFVGGYVFYGRGVLSFFLYRFVSVRLLCYLFRRWTASVVTAYLCAYVWDFISSRGEVIAQGGPPRRGCLWQLGGRKVFVGSCTVMVCFFSSIFILSSFKAGEMEVPF